MASHHDPSLHLLAIDLRSAPSSLRSVLELRVVDVEHWLGRARAAAAPLAIVCGPQSLDLYSTESGRRAAFVPLLGSLRALAIPAHELELVRTFEARGADVMRHLLRQAAGLESTEHAEPYAERIGAACRQAAAAGTLDHSLEALFHLAVATSRRSLAETELAAPTSTRASRQLEALSAERIVEEELIGFRLAAANDQVAESLPSAGSQRPSSLLPPYSATEPGSCVRLKPGSPALSAKEVRPYR